MMFDYRDPINPSLNMAAAVPQPGSLLSLILPAQGQIGLQLCSDGLLDGSILAMQTLIDRITSRAISQGQPLFDSILVAIARNLNQDDSKLLTQLVRSTAVGAGGRRITAAVLRNALRELLPIDKTLDELRSNFDRSAQTASSLLSEILIAGPSLASQVDLFDSQPLLASMLQRAEEALRQSIGTGLVFGRPDVTPADALRLYQAMAGNYTPTAGGDPIVFQLKQQYDQIVDKLQQAIDGGYLPDPLQDPVVFGLKAAYDSSIGGIKLQAALASAVGEILLDSGQAAAKTFFDTINPSLTISGQIQPTLLGIPLGDPTDQIEVRVDKKQLFLSGKFNVLDKVLAMAGLPPIVTGEIEAGIYVPFENLFQDLAFGQFPAIDMNRDWQATFRGTVGLLGIDLGQLSGIIFPSVDGAAIPADHPLATHVQLFEDPDEDEPLLPPSNDENLPTGFRLDDRIVIRGQDRLNLLKQNGGILLDARLELPKLITDPVQVYNDAVAGITGCGTVLECIQQDPLGFFQYAASLPEILGEKVQVSQVQLFVPNVFDDMIGLLGEGASNLASLSAAHLEVALRHLLGASRTELIATFGDRLDVVDIDQLRRPDQRRDPAVAAEWAAQQAAGRHLPGWTLREYSGSGR